MNSIIQREKSEKKNNFYENKKEFIQISLLYFKNLLKDFKNFKESFKKLLDTNLYFICIFLIHILL